MDADERRSRLDQITEKIIGCVHQVSNVLGPGFLEKVYENALAVELGQTGLQVAQQHRIEVRYKNVLVGDFVADLLVEGCVIVEIKAVRNVADEHIAQILGYLRSARKETGLLVNFGAPRFFIKKFLMTEELPE